MNEDKKDVIIYVETDKPNAIIDFAVDQPIQKLKADDIAVLRGEINKEIEFDTTDWERYGEGKYRLIIPRSIHKSNNPYLASMLIYNETDSDWDNNINIYKRLVNDSIVIFSDAPVKCKIVIKGEK